MNIPFVKGTECPQNLQTRTYGVVHMLNAAFSRNAGQMSSPSSLLVYFYENHCLCSLTKMKFKILTLEENIFDQVAQIKE